MDHRLCQQAHCHCGFTAVPRGVAWVLALSLMCGGCMVATDDPTDDDTVDAELTALTEEESATTSLAPAPPRVCSNSAQRGGAPDPACASVPIGFWKFDDCDSGGRQLADSSAQNHPARRSGLTCTDGQSGRAVAIDVDNDLIRVPDQPEYGLDEGVTVAVWARPIVVHLVETVFRKRDSNSPFALIVNEGKFQFSVRLASGRTATVSADAQAERWTHVAATYDRTFLRLYLNGVEAARTRAAGRIDRAAGPLLIGNDSTQRRFPGALDSAWFNTMAAPAETIQALAAPTCTHLAPLASVSPVMSSAVTPGTTVSYTLSITNQDAGDCIPVSFLIGIGLPFGGLTSNPSFSTTVTIARAQTATVPISVTSPSSILPGSYPATFRIIPQLPPDTPGGFAQISAQYVVAP